ncbi:MULTISPECIES: hypothetical protein [Priestia]|uniref:hypothetical protein n=1 Tax=Priestia TaxID=2800373 RepID=UPI002ED78392
MRNKYKLLLLAALITTISWRTIYFLSHDKRTAKAFAEEFYAIPLPPKTTVIDQAFNYGVFYGGGPWGSGGRPTVVAYKKLSSELSEKELVDYYTSNPPLEGIEIYFKWEEKGVTTADNEKKWYEGKTPKQPSEENNTGSPIEVIIQLREEFESAFGEFARP